MAQRECTKWEENPGMETGSHRREKYSQVFIKKKKKNLRKCPKIHFLVVCGLSGYCKAGGGQDGMSGMSVGVLR